MFHHGLADQDFRVVEKGEQDRGGGASGGGQIAEDAHAGVQGAAAEAEGESGGVGLVQAGDPKGEAHALQAFALGGAEGIPGEPLLDVGEHVGAAALQGGDGAEHVGFRVGGEIAHGGFELRPGEGGEALRVVRRGLLKPGAPAVQGLRLLSGGRPGIEVEVAAGPFLQQLQRAQPHAQGGMGEQVDPHAGGRGIEDAQFFAQVRAALIVVGDVEDPDHQFAVFGVLLEVADEPGLIGGEGDGAGGADAVDKGDEILRGDVSGHAVADAPLGVDPEQGGDGAQAEFEGEVGFPDGVQFDQNIVAKVGPEIGIGQHAGLETFGGLLVVDKEDEQGGVAGAGDMPGLIVIVEPAGSPLQLAQIVAQFQIGEGVPVHPVERGTGGAESRDETWREKQNEEEKPARRHGISTARRRRRC